MLCVGAVHCVVTTHPTFNFFNFIEVSQNDSIHSSELGHIVVHYNTLCVALCKNADLVHFYTMHLNGVNRVHRKQLCPCVEPELINAVQYSLKQN